MENEIVISDPYNLYPNIIVYDENNPTLHSPYAENDLCFYQTRETLMDIDTYRDFLKNAERRFRASKEYKAYKAYLIDILGIRQCQVFGNVTVDDADIELHHNILGLFDICVLISSHIINTIGYISTFDLIQLLIMEHRNNRVGVTFLSKTAHQLYTNDPEGYIKPDSTYGRWWELLDRYRYGITYGIAKQIIEYVNKYSNQFDTSVQVMQNEQILSYAWANEYGTPVNELNMSLPAYQETYQIY